MQYAESLLLCGQLIDADKADQNSYEELLCVCPFSKKEVKLDSYVCLGPIQTMEPILISRWEHSEEISAIALDECKRMNKYYKSQKDMADDAARLVRLSLLKPNLWESILSCVLLDNPYGLQNYDDSEKDKLMMWFDQHFENLCNNPLYQARVKQECANLYETCIRETIKDGNNQLFEKISKIYENHNHKIYGQQIASEVLESVLSTWEADDIRKLIYLAVNEEVCQAARTFSYEMAGIVRRELKRPKGAEFMNLWIQEKYSGMERILDISRRLPELAKAFKSGLATIDVMFTINLCLMGYTT